VPEWRDLGDGIDGGDELSRTPARETAQKDGSRAQSDAASFTKWE
jgi:hypothetical protein